MSIIANMPWAGLPEERELAVFIAQDILDNPIGFIESWQTFGQPMIYILVQNAKEQERVERLSAIGLVPQDALIVTLEDLAEAEEDREIVVFGFEDTMPEGLPQGTQELRFASLGEDEALNWNRVFALLITRLGIEVENLPDTKGFNEASLVGLRIGESLYTISVGVSVSDDIQRAYQSFRDTVGGV